MASPVTIAYGDGGWPEVMEAVLCILAEARAPVSIEAINLGENQYKIGNKAGIDSAARETLRRSRALLRSPLIVPVEGEVRHPDEAIGQMMGIVATLCHLTFCFPALEPLTVMRMSAQEEDKIADYAFAYAHKHKIDKITFISKEEASVFSAKIQQSHAHYPAIEYTIAHEITVSGNLELIITEASLYQALIRQIIEERGVKVIKSYCHAGENFGLFETGQEVLQEDNYAFAHLLHAAVHLLVYKTYVEIANRIYNALLVTLESGFHENAGLQEWKESIIANLGKNPLLLKPIRTA